MVKKEMIKSRTRQLPVSQASLVSKEAFAKFGETHLLSSFEKMEKEGDANVLC